jgi:uncharacterized membrane protein YphA (DoxX/SURF4 family)
MRHETRVRRATIAIRISLGLMFVMTGVMKFAVPSLRAAFSGQLTAAGIPLHSLNMWLVPALEIGIGGFFLLGMLTRLASFSAASIMAVATYVHLVVNDAALFPLQPKAPIIPLMVMALSAYLLVAGIGARTTELRGKSSSA